MREWLRRVLGRTKLERIEQLQRAQAVGLERLQREQAAGLEQLQRDQAERTAALAASLAALAQDVQATTEKLTRQIDEHLPAAITDEILQMERRLLVAVQEHRQQMLTLGNRIDQLALGLGERDQLRQRLADEQARARELADQTGHLLTELGAERRALLDLRARAEVDDAVRARLDTAERELQLAQRERDVLRAQAERLEASGAAVERAREALRGELARVTRQRDDALRQPQDPQAKRGAAGAGS